MALRVRQGPPQSHRKDPQAAPAQSATTLRLTLSSQSGARASAPGTERGLIGRIRALQVQDELQALIEAIRALPNPSESLTSWLNSWELCSVDTDELEKEDLIAKLILEVLYRDSRTNPAVFTIIKTATFALQRLLPEEKDVGIFLEEKKAVFKEERKKEREANKAAKAQAKALKLQLSSNREAQLIHNLRNLENPPVELQRWLAFWELNAGDLDEEAKREALAELILDILVPFFEESEVAEEITTLIQSAFLVLHKLLPQKNVSNFLGEKLLEKQREEEALLEPLLIAQLEAVQAALPIVSNWINDWNQDLNAQDRKILLAFLISKILVPAFEQTGGNSFIFGLNDLARKLLQKMLGEESLIEFLFEVQKADAAENEDALVEDLSDCVQSATNDALSGLMDEFDDARSASRLKVREHYQKVAERLQSLDEKRQALTKELADQICKAQEEFADVRGKAKAAFKKQDEIQKELAQAYDQAMQFLQEMERVI